VRISTVTIELSTEDINSLLEEFASETRIRLTDISPDGIRGHVKLFLWNVDFLAKPSFGIHSDVSLDVSAHKLVPIPSAIVQRQLKEAVKDAPPGVDVIRQALRVHLPSLLEPFGISLGLQELQCHQGFVRVTVDSVQLPKLKQLVSSVVGK
jgi:hypothetical protein